MGGALINAQCLWVEGVCGLTGLRNCSGGLHHQGLPTITQENSWLWQWSYVVSLMELIHLQGHLETINQMFIPDLLMCTFKIYMNWKGKLKRGFAVNRGLNVLLLCRSAVLFWIDPATGLSSKSQFPSLLLQHSGSRPQEKNNGPKKLGFRIAAFRAFHSLQ